MAKEETVSRVTKQQCLRYQEALDKVIGRERSDKGIGTLSEKTVHAILKYYYGPEEGMQEVPVAKCVADVFTGSEIFEIQTRSFDRLRTKLELFLPLYPVTVVYPIPYVKWLCWIDEETGEISKKRKSPRKGSPYMVFPELYKIKPFLTDPNLHVRLMLMDMEEYRLLNGWSRDRKKGSTRFDRLPVRLEEEVVLDGPRDYLQFLPMELPESFTSKDLGAASRVPVSLAGTILGILLELGVVERIGKQGRCYQYRINPLYI